MFHRGNRQLDPLVPVRGDVMPRRHVAKQLRQRKRVVAEDAILGRWKSNLGPILGLRFGDRGLLFVELLGQGCQMAKFDPFLSLDCARVEGVGRNPRKGRDQILQHGVAEP